jgi:hypothetical protein
MEESRDELQSLNENNTLSETKSEGKASRVSTVSTLLSYSLAIFLAILLYQMTERIYALNQKQDEKHDILNLYQDAARTLEQKIKILNLTASAPFTEEDLATFSIIKK